MLKSKKAKHLTQENRKRAEENSENVKGWLKK